MSINSVNSMQRASVTFDVRFPVLSNEWTRFGDGIHLRKQSDNVEISCQILLNFPRISDDDRVILRPDDRAGST